MSVNSIKDIEEFEAFGTESFGFGSFSLYNKNKGEQILIHSLST